jgi:hypothetical protein
MGNTEGGRMNRLLHKQIYSSGSTSVLECCRPRTTLSTETTPPASSLYAANPCPDIIPGESPRTTYQGGLSQAQVQALLATTVRNYRTESLRSAAEACPPYVPPFSRIIPPLIVCPPLDPPPLPPMIPGTNPTRCINTRY